MPRNRLENDDYFVLLRSWILFKRKCAWNIILISNINLKQYRRHNSSVKLKIPLLNCCYNSATNVDWSQRKIYCVRWSVANRCRAEAGVTRLLSQPERNSPQSKQTSFVSQQHWTTHYSTLMQPQPWNKASLLPLCFFNMVATQWALLSCHDAIFDHRHEERHVDNRWFHEPRTGLPTGAHKTLKNAAGRDKKAGGLEFPMYALTTLRFSTLPVRTALAM